MQNKLSYHSYMIQLSRVISAFQNTYLTRHSRAITMTLILCICLLRFELPASVIALLLLLFRVTTIRKI